MVHAWGGLVLISAAKQPNKLVSLLSYLSSRKHPADVDLVFVTKFVFTSSWFATAIDVKH